MPASAARVACGSLDAPLAQGGGDRCGVVGQLGELPLAQFGVGGDHGLALAGTGPGGTRRAWRRRRRGLGPPRREGRRRRCAGDPGHDPLLRRADPPKSTSRLSAKCRKKVRSVTPARAAISAAVVWSNPRSAVQRERRLLQPPPTVRLPSTHDPILALTVTDIRSRVMAVTDINVSRR